MHPTQNQLALNRRVSRGLFTIEQITNGCVLALILILAGCVIIPPGVKEGDGHYSAGDRKAALHSYEDALPKIKKNTKPYYEVTQKIQNIRKEITDSVLGEAANLRKEGKTIPVLTKVVARLKDNLEFDDDTKRLSKAQQESSDLLGMMTKDYDHLMEDIQTGRTANAWTAVVLAYRRTLALKPSAEMGAQLEAWIKERDVTVSAAIDDMVSKKDLDGADKLLKQWTQETPEPDKALVSPRTANLDSVRQQVLEARLGDLLALKKYYTAFQLIKDSNQSYLNSRIAEVRRLGATHYKAKALAEKSAGETRVGYAFFAAEKAFQLNSNDDETFTLRRQLNDLMNDVITYRIAVKTFNPPSKEPEAGAALANSLIEYLMNTAPYGIRMMERTEVDALLNEKGVPDLSKMDMDPRAKVRLFIVGDVSTLNVERQNSPREGTARVLTGKTQEPNPEYQKYLKEYGRNKNKWPVELQDLGPMVEKQTEQLLRYKLGEETINGTMEVSIRSFEGSGSITTAKMFRSTFTTNDTYSDQVSQATPPVALDPLGLPTDTEIKKELRDTLAKEIGEFVLGSFKNRERRFLQSAQVALDRREAHLAVAELAACYFYCQSDKKYVPNAEENPTFKDARRLGLFDLTE